MEKPTLVGEHYLWGPQSSSRTLDRRRAQIFCSMLHQLNGLCARSVTERTEQSGRLLAVDNPWYAKLVNEHTETKGPKCFLEGHLNSSVFC